MTRPLSRPLPAPRRTPGGPVSRVCPLDGRGRRPAAVRRVHGPAGGAPGVLRLAPVPAVVAVRDWWSGLVQRRCGSREVAAAMFGTAFQTACNWFDGTTCPNAGHLLAALALWPDEFPPVALVPGGARPPAGG